MEIDQSELTKGIAIFSCLRDPITAVLSSIEKRVKIMWERPENLNIDKALNRYIKQLLGLLKNTGINPIIHAGILYTGADNCDENCTGDHCDYCDANSKKYEMITDSPSVQKQVGVLERCIRDNYVRGGGIYTRTTGGFIEYIKYISGSVYGNVFIYLRLKYSPCERKVFGRNSNSWGTDTDIPTLAHYITLQYLTDVSFPKMPNRDPSYEEDQLMLLAGKHFLKDLLHDYISQKHDGFIGDLNIVSRIIKTISKGVVFIISPSLERLFRRSSYLRYNQYKHCGFVAIALQLDWFEVTQTTVTCLNW